MRTRDWGTTDFYAVLGVAPSAGTAEIAAAYRARAKELHPDARPGDIAAAEQFKDVSAAYQVLSEPATRNEYDTYRRMRPRSSYAGYVPPTVQPSSAPAPSPRPGVTTAVTARGGARFQLTRRGAKWAVLSGILCILGGIGFGWLVLSLEHHDSQLWDRGRSAVATAVEVNGNEQKIRYDPTDPTDVIADTDTTARDVTLWIVSVKLLICGPLLVIFGALRLRRRP
jgi:hypothetical protein